MSGSSRKVDNSDTPKRGTWIRREHYKLDMIHYSLIFSLLGGAVFFGGLLFMSYVDITKPLVKAIIGFLI